jgi:hypothetical protein
MAIARKNRNSEDDFLTVGPDATATFDNSASNPTEHASSENLRAPQVEDDDLEEEEDADEEEEFDEEEDDEDEEDDDDEEDEIEDVDEVEDEEEADEDEDEEDEEDHDLATGPKPPSVYRKI